MRQTDSFTGPDLMLGASDSRLRYGLSERTVNLINNNVEDPDTAKLLIGSVGGGLSALNGAASLTCSAFLAINLINDKTQFVDC